MDRCQVEISAKGITVEKEWKAASDEIAFNRHLSVQILTNLLFYATQMTPPGKKVRVATQSIDSAQTAPALQVLVEDMGPPIAPKYLPVFFDSHVDIPGRGKGASLGLHICRDLILKQGGRIEAFSASHGGTCIAACFPQPTAECAATGFHAGEKNVGGS
jgi:K+-sensing histidine kinase KdpD